MTLPYLESGAATGAQMNDLFAEWDRKMTLALDGLSPLLRTGLFGGADANSGIGGGVPFTTGTNLFGTIYVFKTNRLPLVYLKGLQAYDHSRFQAAAEAAVEVPGTRDEVNETVQVTVPGSFVLGYSLEAHRRNIGPKTYWLVPVNAGGGSGVPRPMRHHRYAVAELCCEGGGSFYVPDDWNRYECFRIHNFSRVAINVTIPWAHSVPLITVPPYGCRSFRRTLDGYFDASLNYCWKFRNEKERPSIWMGSGQGTLFDIPETSQRANNLANPAGFLLGWFKALNLERDPAVVRNELPRYASLFGDPASGDCKLGDLLHHKGAVWGLVGGGGGGYLKGQFTGYPNLATDLAAVGVTVSQTEHSSTLSSSTGKTEIFGPGTNLTLLSAGTPTFVKSLPFALPRTIWADVPEFLTTLRTSYTTESYTEPPDYLAEFSPYRYSSGGAVISPRVTYSLQIEQGDQFDPTGTWKTDTTRHEAEQTLLHLPPPEAGLVLSDWHLSPQGFAVNATFSRPVRRQGIYADLGLAPASSSWGGNWTAGLYTSLSPAGVFSATARLSLLGLYDGTDFCRSGWPTDDNPAFHSPLNVRAYGRAQRPPGLPVWAYQSPDFTGYTGVAGGGDIQPAARTTEKQPDLKALQRIESGGFVPASTPYECYRVSPDTDGGRGKLIQLGAPYSLPDDGTGIVHYRLPRTPDSYNYLAWTVNAITRIRPVYEFGDFWLGRDELDSVVRLPANAFGYGALNHRPANQYMRFSGEADALAASYATGITVRRESSQPDWAAAAAVQNPSMDGKHVGVIITGTNGDVQTWTARLADNVDITQDFGGTTVHIDVDGGPNYEVDIWGECWWLSADDVAAFAAARGLPFRHATYGAAWKLKVIDGLKAADIPFEMIPGVTINNFVPEPYTAGWPEPLNSPPLANYIRFVPPADAGEIGWISDDHSQCWNLTFRQLTIGNTGGGDLPPGPFSGGLTQQGRFNTGCFKPDEVHRVDARLAEGMPNLLGEVHAIGRRTWLPAGTTDDTRLLLVPGLGIERPPDFLNSIARWDNAFVDGITTIPCTLLNPEERPPKSIAFTGSSLFTPEAHQLWNSTLWPQVYVSAT